jgi:hypothetical protein
LQYFFHEINLVIFNKGAKIGANGKFCLISVGFSYLVIWFFALLWLRFVEGFYGSQNSPDPRRMKGASSFRVDHGAGALLRK